MGSILAGGQILTSLLIVFGIGVLLWAKGRDTRYLERLLAVHVLTGTHERAAQAAALLAAIAGNQQLLVDLVTRVGPLSGPPGAPSARTLLVIEDDPDHRELARLVLEKAGYTVRMAADAEAGLRSIGSAGLPDLIVADVHLPHMDGLEFVRQMRAAGGRMPVIAYSGDDEGAGRRKALEAGCNDFVSKEGESAPLLACIAQWLGIAAHVHGQLP